MSNTCQSWVYFSNPAGPGSIRGSWTLPVTWESNGTSSTLAFWPWSKKALKHVLNFKHMSAPTHIKGLLIHWKLSICRNTLWYQLLCWASYRITPYQVTFWKKRNQQQNKLPPKQKLTWGGTADRQGLPRHMWPSPLEPHVLLAPATAAQQHGASPGAARVQSCCFSLCPWF